MQGDLRRPRTVLAGLATLLLMAVASEATASTPASVTSAAPRVFAGHTMNGQPLPCVVHSDGVRLCTGDESGPGAPDLRFQSFDGTPLMVYVTLPPATSKGPHGRFPLIAQNHGWGDPPTGPNDPQYAGPTADQWAKSGYAVLQFAARGWGDSCGSVPSRLVNPTACLHGYVHLDDYRYEARDVQDAIGLLVDEGLVDPHRIGATGESYGAGLSLDLATLKDRIMNADGSLSPWRSPKGTPISLAAAAPQFGWSDLVTALAPNGRTMDSTITSPTADLSPVGVEKQSILTGLYAVGSEGAYFAPPGLDPEADAMTWFAQTSAGEPYTSSAIQSQVRAFAQFRSPYYLLDGAYGTATEAPAPLSFTNGFTDDVFPVDEALRFMNLERHMYANDPVTLFAYDGGHQRGDNKLADGALVLPRVKAFFDHYVKRTGPQPTLGVTALTQKCPTTDRSDGPFWASTWAGLHPGRVDYQSAAAQQILSAGGDPTVAATFDTIGSTEVSAVNGQGWACQTASATPEPGVATYRLPAATGAGYTLLGSPTVTADLQVTGQFAYIAARLVDVDPATNTKTLIDRGLYRIDPTEASGRQTFQLHPGAWHFAPGHIPELELLGKDTPYSRASNGAFVISVLNLDLQLPIHEASAS